MISVVMPLFNKVAFVEKAITSVLSQTYQDFELLIVNDGSTDSSLQKVAGFEDVRIKILSTHNKGVSAARNTGVKEAVNDYVALLDADDWWAPTYLEEIVKMITAFPENKLFASGRTHVFSEKEVAYTNSLLPKKGEIGLVNHFRVIAKYLPAINSSNLTVQKNYFLEKGGFNEVMQHFEDHECWLRLALKQPIVFVNKPLSFYNKNVQESMSQTLVRSSDLQHYFDTILLVKEQLMGKEKRCFRKFYQRFAKWSYLKYAPTYTEKEQVLLQESLLQLLSTLEVKILDELQKAGLAKIYQRAKNRRNGRA